MDPFVGQLALFPYNFAPQGWALCQGQIMPISQNAALFSLIGTYYGGNGTSNFGLPDLRGRVPNGQGTGPGLQSYSLGEVGGVQGVQLLPANAPAHSHPFYAFAGQASTNSPAGALPAEAVIEDRGAAPVNTYAAAGQATALATALVNPVAGGGQAHNNMQPFLALSWCIALQGIFPTRP